MKFTVTSKTTAACLDYLHVIDNGEKLSLKDFAQKHKGENLDSLIKTCEIDYRGKVIGYNDYIAQHLALCQSLPFLQRYGNEIIPIEPLLLIGNASYYKSAKFLNKAENCLQTARNYLINCATLLDYNCNIKWSCGYGGQFMLRSFDLATAITWYNNCYDYVLQVVYLAFELYKLVPKYSTFWTFEDTLKKCSYKTIKDIYMANSTISNFTALWIILDSCRTQLQDVNEWANYIKHKGGLEIIGLYPEPPFYMMITDANGNKVAESGEFYPIKIDMDNAITVLQNAHKALYDCLNQITTFIDYSAAVPQTNPDGKMLIPDKRSYVKVIIP